MWSGINSTTPRGSRGTQALDFSVGGERQYEESVITRYPDDQSLLEACHSQSVDLLKRNLTPGGILAASPTLQADKRGYTAIFGRDAAVCAIGMLLSGDQSLARAASEIGRAHV